MGFNSAFKGLMYRPNYKVVGRPAISALDNVCAAECALLHTAEYILTEVIPMCYIKLLRIYNFSLTHLFIVVKLCI